MEWAKPDVAAPGGPPPAVPDAHEPTVAPRGTEAPPLSPMTVSDILDGAFAMLRRAPATVLLLTAAFVVPMALLAGFMQRDLVQSTDPIDVLESGDTSLLASDSADGSDSVLQLAAVLPSSLALVFVAAGMARLASAWQVGSDLTAGELLRGSWPRAGALIGSWALVKLAQGLGFFTCGIGTLALMAWFLPLAPIIGVERLGATDAMRRSARLVNRRFWRVLGLGVLAGLVSTFLGMVVEIVPLLLAWVTGIDAYGWVAVSLMSAATLLITTPIVAGAAVMTYLDLRVRTEGLDLELDAREAFAVPA